MKIGIVGAGNIGSVLARKLARAGHAVRVANSRGPHTLEAFADDARVTAVSLRDVAQGVDAVILSIPFARLPLLRDVIAELPKDAVVADTSNYFPIRDGKIAAVDAGQVESLWVSEQIGRPVVKAWNNVLAGILEHRGMPAGVEGRLALSVAGDDPGAKEVAMSLVEDCGFDAVDGGLLAESWRQQPITRAYCSELSAPGLRTALAVADRARAPRLREEMVEAFVALGERATPEDIARLHRAASAKG